MSKISKAGFLDYAMTESLLIKKSYGFLLMNNRGTMGEGIMMIYSILLVSFIAFVILGISSVLYAHDIDVRDVEARILARNIMECVSPDGVLDLDVLSVEDRKNILSYCGFDSVGSERVYLELKVENSGEVTKLSQGDSGALWVLEIFESDKLSEGLKKYEPGYYDWSYPVYVLDGGSKFTAEVKGQVLISNEF
ncbi:MAG: hypothetical protein U9Q73_02570 [Nanoarchaeota archaeon]|nr:hypothetical protein [Nanoarchaeota archaeon]